MRLLTALSLCALIFVLNSTANVIATPRSPDLALSQYAQNRIKPSNLKGSATPNYLTMNDFAKVKTKLDKHVSLQGTVSSFREAWNGRAPNIIYTTNGKDNFEIVFWTEENETAYRDKFSKKGAPFFVTGVVQNYNGRLQLKVEDNKFLSSTPLNSSLLAKNLTEADYQQHTEKTEAKKEDKQGIKWEQYSPLKVQQALTSNGYTLVYVRADSSSICSKFEQAYLLHKDAYATMGEQTIYFINASEPMGLDFAKQLKVARVPSLILLKDGEAKSQMFVYTDKSTPRDVFQFMNSVPRK